MTRSVLALWLFGLLLLNACSGGPGCPPPEAVPSPPKAHDLIQEDWLHSGKTFHLRQAVVLEFGSHTISMTGFMVLDTARSTAKVVALTDFGISLFSMTVTSTGHVTHKAMPAVENIPGFQERAAEAIRRMFLAPLAAEDDGYYAQTRHSATLYGRDSRTGLASLYSIPDSLLRIKEWSGCGRDWRAVYSEYRRGQGENVPSRILYTDKKHGFRLTLTLLEIRTHE